MSDERRPRLDLARIRQGLDRMIRRRIFMRLNLVLFIIVVQPHSLTPRTLSGVSPSFTGYHTPNQTQGRESGSSPVVGDRQ